MQEVTLSDEQIACAPASVRAWIEARAAVEPAHPSSDALDLSGTEHLSCATSPEIDALFAALAADFHATFLLYELGRRSPRLIEINSLCGHAIGDVLCRSRLQRGERLLGPLQAIADAYQRIRQAPQATLFGLHPDGYIFTRAETFAAIERHWNGVLRGLDLIVESCGELHGEGAA